MIIFSDLSISLSSIENINKDAAKKAYNNASKLILLKIRNPAAYMQLLFRRKISTQC